MRVLLGFIQKMIEDNLLTMGRSGVKALPSPRSFKPLWSSDGKINTTRGKRGLELPPIRQGISSGASAVSNDGLQNH